VSDLERLKLEATRAVRRFNDHAAVCPWCLPLRGVLCLRAVELDEQASNAAALSLKAQADALRPD
jgi:hypothetical protein